MISAGSGADSGPVLPGYEPILRSAPGPQSVAGRAASAGVTAGGSRRLGLALLVIATAQLMVVLDATIVNVALPHVQRALGFSGTGLEFLTLFMQNVLGYSAIRSGIAYLPFPVGVVIGSALAAPLVARMGPRPLILAGAAVVAGGTFWLSRLTEHAGYASQLLGPQHVSSFGLGLVFVPLSLVALHKVAGQDSGVASSLLNAGQQVGGAIGLALLGTVAWTAVAGTVRTQVAYAAAAAAKAGRPLPKLGAPPPASIYDHAQAVGFSRGFVVAAGIGLLALLIGIATIRVSRQDLAGAVPEPQEAAPQPRTLERHEDQAALAAAVRPCRLC